MSEELGTLGTTETSFLMNAMTPSEYKVITKQTEITKARMTVFFFSCLLMSEISFSAPGTVSSIFFRVEFVLRSRDVCPSS